MAFSIYYMLTPRCLLNCGYCFRDTSQASLNRELTLTDKKRAITALIENLDVRKITLSGGEPTIMGGVVLKDFLELIEHIKDYKKIYPELRIELLSNAILLEKDVLLKLVGAVDRITITLDTINEAVLQKIGRNTAKYKDYLGRFKQRMMNMYELGFETKLHTVVTPVNYDYLVELASFIKQFNHLFKINRWKFYQYMTYDDPIKDAIYEIDDDRYHLIISKISQILSDTAIDVTFKDNKLMIDSMLNLNHDGRLEHVSFENGKKENYLSKQIWNYRNLNELLKDIHLSLEKLTKYHGFSYE